MQNISQHIESIASGSAATTNIAAALSWANQGPKHLPYLPLSVLEGLLDHLTPVQLAHLRIPPLEYRRLDFLVHLPTELSLHILSFVDDAKTLLRARRVSKAWNRLAQDESIWKRLCILKGFISYENDPVDEPARLSFGSICRRLDPNFLFRSYFRSAQTIENNYLSSGHLLRTHRSHEAGIVSSLALDSSWIVVGLANGRVHVFSARTGILARTLSGHQAGAWCVWIVEKGRAGMDPSSQQHHDTEIADSQEQESSTAPDPLSSSVSSSSSSNMPFHSIFENLYLNASSKETHDDLLDFDSPNSPSHKLSLLSNSSDGWGQPNSLVVSAACDKTLRVWDITTGYCLHVLKGHRSTVRCLKMFHGRPVAVTGGRDTTVRIWDIRKGALLGTLEGHTESVRCLDVYGDMIVSGSYDCSVRLWSAKTRQCLRVYNGHYHQVYTVAFDGSRIVSGGLDTSVRVWSIDSNDCVALLQGHTALVCQLQLSPSTNTIISGSADGRIIIFGIPPHSSFRRRDSISLSTPRPASLALPSPTVLQGSASPPSSPGHSSLLLHSPLQRPRGGESLNDTFRIISSMTAHTSSMTGLHIDEDVPETVYDGREWVKHRRHGRRKWLVSAGTDGRVLLWSIGGDDSEGHPTSTEHSHNSQDSVQKLVQVRTLTEPNDGVWKTAIRGDVLVICCSRNNRTVLEIWSFKDEQVL